MPRAHGSARTKWPDDPLRLPQHDRRRRLCHHALWIDRGKLCLEGPVAEVVAGYLKEGSAQTGERLWPSGPHAPGDDLVRLRSARVSAPNGQTTASIDISQPFTIEWEFDLAVDGLTVFPTLRLFNEWGTEVLWTTDTTSSAHGRPRSVGRHLCRVQFPANLLAEGFFSVTLSVASLSPTHGPHRRGRCPALPGH